MELHNCWNELFASLPDKSQETQMERNINPRGGGGGGRLKENP